MYREGTSKLNKRFPGEGNISMETAEQYFRFAVECERLANQLPAHAEALQKIAEAWRRLAVAAEQKEKSTKS